MGTKKKTQFRSKTITLKPGEKVLLYSDGLLENQGPNQEVFSKRALDQLCKSHEGNAKQLLANIIQAGKERWQSTPPEDDRTILVMEWLDGEGKTRVTDQTLDAS